MGEGSRDGEVVVSASNTGQRVVKTARGLVGADVATSIGSTGGAAREEAGGEQPCHNKEGTSSS